MAMEIPLDGVEVPDTSAEDVIIVRTLAGPSFPLTLGMEVCGAEGVVVGRLKAVNEADLLVDRPLHRDVYVPFDAIQAVLEGRLVLAVRADEIDATDWPKPALLPFHGD